eukprot:scaffold978_cov118-Isochrysis_galbana.AAC.5
MASSTERAAERSAGGPRPRPRAAPPPPARRSCTGSTRPAGFCRETRDSPRAMVAVPPPARRVAAQSGDDPPRRRALRRSGSPAR